MKCSVCQKQLETPDEWHTIHECVAYLQLRVRELEATQHSAQSDFECKCVANQSAIVNGYCTVCGGKVIQSR